MADRIPWDKFKLKYAEHSKLAERTWGTEILNLVAEIHECKGRQDLFIRQKPVELDRLVEIAKIQSTEASNKIEGIVTTSARIKNFLRKRRLPATGMKMKSWVKI